MAEPEDISVAAPGVKTKKRFSLVPKFMRRSSRSQKEKEEMEDGWESGNLPPGKQEKTDEECGRTEQANRAARLARSGGVHDAGLKSGSSDHLPGGGKAKSRVTQVREGYETLVCALIRPPRVDYPLDDLGEKMLLLNCGEMVRRTDFELINSRGLKILCSHWVPASQPGQLIDVPPCVLRVRGRGVRAPAVGRAGGRRVRTSL